MYTGLLHLHSLLRWIILVLLIVNIVKLAGGNKSISLSKWLLIAAHTTLVLGLYQYFFGHMGFELFKAYGSEVMKMAPLRFWAVEHITGMVLSIALVTIGHISLKKTGNTKKTAMLYTVALIVILAVIPWPFRAGIGRPWFPGMH
jgi:hypothetical protein